MCYCFEACSWHNRECKLTLHIDNGFTLYDINQNNALLWQQGYEKLRRSADNNQSLLYFDFESEEGTIVRTCLSCFLSLYFMTTKTKTITMNDNNQHKLNKELNLHSSPKPFVFTLHSFLAAKLSHLALK